MQIKDHFIVPPFVSTTLLGGLRSKVENFHIQPRCELELWVLDLSRVF